MSGWPATTFSSLDHWKSPAAPSTTGPSVRRRPGSARARKRSESTPWKSRVHSSRSRPSPWKVSLFGDWKTASCAAADEAASRVTTRAARMFMEIVPPRGNARSWRSARCESIPQMVRSAVPPGGGCRAPVGRSGFFSRMPCAAARGCLRWVLRVPSSGGPMSDFHQYGTVTALPRLVDRPLEELESRVLELSKRFPVALIVPMLPSEMDRPALGAHPGRAGAGAVPRLARDLAEPGDGEGLPALPRVLRALPRAQGHPLERVAPHPGVPGRHAVGRALRGRARARAAPAGWRSATCWPRSASSTSRSRTRTC